MRVCVLSAVLRVQVICVQCWAVVSVRLQVWSVVHGRLISAFNIRAFVAMRGVCVRQWALVMCVPVLMRSAWSHT